MKLLQIGLLTLGVFAFVLWPILFYGRGRKLTKKEERMMRKEIHKRTRRMAGAIPVYEGKVFLISSRKTRKLVFPKGGVEPGEAAYITAGRETIEEGGLVGRIDTEPVYEDERTSWHVLEVTRILEGWRERSERFRLLLGVPELLMHSEVKGATKEVLRHVLSRELKMRGQRARLQRPHFALPGEGEGEGKSSSASPAQSPQTSGVEAQRGV